MKVNFMKISFFKTFFLALCLAGHVEIGYAQTASILPPAKTTFLDQNGKPLVSGTVDFYVPGTTTRKTTWKDAGQTIANTNPVVLDGAGRGIILGDGSYRQRVTDRYGNVIWDQVTSSAGSGGGGGGTPTVGDGDAVGTVKAYSGFIAPYGYVFAYGQEFVRASYPEAFAAITSQQNVSCTIGSPTLTVSSSEQLPIGAAIESTCLNAGSTIIAKATGNITASSNAIISTSTSAIFFPFGNGDGALTFNIPDLRGRVIAGRDNMGVIAANRLTSLYDSLASSGGSATVKISQSGLPNISPNFTGASGSVSVTSTNTNIISSSAVIGISASGGSSAYALNSDAARGGVGSTGSFTPSGTVSSINGNTTQTETSIIQPTQTSNYVIKIIPDSNPNSFFGVASIGGMYGVITCGSGLTCAGNDISAVTPNLTPPTPTALGGIFQSNAPSNEFAIGVDLAGNILYSGGSTAVNGQVCTIGGSCTITASAGSITVGTTIITSGLSNALLYNDSGTLGNITTANNRVLGTDGSGTPSWVTTLPSAVTGSSLTSVGTLTGGSTSTGFTLNFTNSTKSGVIPVVNGGSGQANPVLARSSTGFNIDQATSTGDANYSILSTDRMVYHTALSAPRTDTLPAANSVNAGQEFTLNDFRGVVTGTNTVTIQRTGSDTINGTTSLVALNSAYGAGVFWSDGVSRWTYYPQSGGGGGGTPGGSSGQIQYNNGGSFGGFTASGDATVNTSTGAVSVSKIGGVPVTTSGSTTGDVLSYDGSGYIHTALATAINLACSASPTTCYSFYGYLSPYWYGALCDGSTDDTTAMTNMVAAASSKLIRLPPATCVINSSLTLLGGTTIKGAGRNVSTIKMTGAAVIFSVANVSDIDLEDFAMLGTRSFTSWSSSNTGAISITASSSQSNYVLRNLALSGFNSTYWIVGSQTAGTITNTTFDNLLITSTTADVPTDANPYNNTNYFIVLYSGAGGSRWENTTISNSQLTQTGVCFGITLYSDHYKYNVINNRILSPGGANTNAHCTNALGATNAYGILVYDVIADGNPPVNGIISGNYILNPIAAGIYFAGDAGFTNARNSNRTLISNNEILGQSHTDTLLPRGAIAINTSTDLTITGNALFNNQIGINLGGQNTGNISVLANYSASYAGSSIGLQMTAGANGSSNTDMITVQNNFIDADNGIVLNSTTGGRFYKTVLSDNTVNGRVVNLSAGSQYFIDYFILSGNNFANSTGTYSLSLISGGVYMSNNRGMNFTRALVPTLSNGSSVYITDGTSGACAAGGTGAMAFFQAGAMKCL